MRVREALFMKHVCIAGSYDRKFLFFCCIVCAAPRDVIIIYNAEKITKYARLKRNEYYRIYRQKRILTEQQREAKRQRDRLYRLRKKIKKATTSDESTILKLQQQHERKLERERSYRLRRKYACLQAKKMQMAGLLGEIKQEKVDEVIPETNTNQIENVDTATFPKFVYNTPSSSPPSPTAFASSSSSVSNSGNEVDAQSTKQRKHYFNKLFLVIEQERKESREEAQQFKILLDKLVDAENRKATAIENISDCLQTLTDKILNAHK